MPAPSITSRFLNVPLERDAAGRTLFEIRAPLRYRPLPSTKRVIFQQGDTLHHLAYREYGDPGLWWAIADFNGIFDPTSEATPGREILLPPRAYIEDYLSPSEG